MVASFAAPQTPLDGLDAALRDRGFAVLSAANVAALSRVPLADLQALTPSWDDLRPDEYLKDGGRYRKRRHACFVAEADGLHQVPHRMHWQSVDYNALHGGMERWFEPIEPAVATQSAWSNLLLGLARVCSARMPVPRAYEFVDGSAYLPHVARVRKARGAEVPESFYTDPLMYQGVSAGFYGPRDPVKVVSEDYGIDLEAEIVIVTDDVPMAVTPEQAAGHIQLVGLINDVSLRNLIPGELAKGFGFLQSKPRSALSPVFVTPDELGAHWQGNKLHLPLLTHINGKWFGAPEAGVDMQFDFAQLLAHAAKTRPLSAGTIVGSGTVANEDTSLGASCFAEQRTVETLRDGKPTTPFMAFGDTVRIEVLDRDGISIFGAIEQRIECQPAP